jgi:hypothetical protein
MKDYIPCYIATAKHDLNLVFQQCTIRDALHIQLLIKKDSRVNVLS